MGKAAVLSETERWRAAILSSVRLGDLPALETEVSGWTELAGWRCVNSTNNPGNMRRVLEEEETAAYHVLLASFICSLCVPRKSPVACAVQKLEILVDLQRELQSKVDGLLQEHHQRRRSARWHTPSFACQPLLQPALLWCLDQHHAACTWPEQQLVRLCQSHS